MQRGPPWQSRPQSTELWRCRWWCWAPPRPLPRPRCWSGAGSRRWCCCGPGRSPSTPPARRTRTTRPVRPRQPPAPRSSRPWRPARPRASPASPPSCPPAAPGMAGQPRSRPGGGGRILSSCSCREVGANCLDPDVIRIIFDLLLKQYLL